MLDVILIIVSALCMIAGLAGCVLPFLPAPPIAYLGLVFRHSCISPWQYNHVIQRS